MLERASPLFPAPVKCNQSRTNADFKKDSELLTGLAAILDINRFLQITSKSLSLSDLNHVLRSHVYWKLFHFFFVKKKPAGLGSFFMEANKFDFIIFKTEIFVKQRYTTVMTFFNGVWFDHIFEIHPKKCSKQVKKYKWISNKGDNLRSPWHRKQMRQIDWLIN